MDEISKLLQEAKPLYLARKRTRKRIKAVLCTLVGVIMVGWVSYRQPAVVDTGDWVDYEQYTSTASPAEEMGLPVDEYGLLMVS